MAKLELQVVGYNDVLDNMQINGKKCKFTVNEDKTRTCFVEADRADIVICKTHFYTGKAWFWWSLLYYIISIFGIFDLRQNKRCQVIDCRFEVNLEKDKKVILKIQNFEDGGAFAEIESEETINLINNTQYFDKVAQKRIKKMKKAKFAISFLTIITVALILIFLI